jgi:hypothetical protein
MNIPIEDMETCLCVVLATQNFTSGQKGTSMHMGKTSTKGCGQSVLPYIPDTNNLPLDLDWSRSKVHNLLDYLKFYTYLGEVLRYIVQWAILVSRGGSTGIWTKKLKYRKFKW